MKFHKTLTGKRLAGPIAVYTTSENTKVQGLGGGGCIP